MTTRGLIRLTPAGPYACLLAAIGIVSVLVALSLTPQSTSEFAGTLNYREIVLPGFPSVTLITPTETFALCVPIEPGWADRLRSLSGQQVIVRGQLESRLTRGLRKLFSRLIHGPRDVGYHYGRIDWRRMPRIIRVFSLEPAANISAPRQDWRRPQLKAYPLTPINDRFVVTGE